MGPGRSPEARPTATGTTDPITAATGAATFIGPIARARYSATIPRPPPTPAAAPQPRSAGSGRNATNGSAAAVTTIPTPWTAATTRSGRRAEEARPPRKSATP
jgi:hypothetical protein